jgi:hypothetical protein
MFGNFRNQRELAWELHLEKRYRIQAEARYLDKLRRDLATLLLLENPDALLSAWEKAARYHQELAAATPERRRSEAEELKNRFRFFTDFDILGLRHFKPWLEPHERLGRDELSLILAYLDINRQLTLLSLEDASFDIHPFLDSDINLLNRVVNSRKDQLLRKEIDIALNRYHGFSRCSKKSYEDDKYYVSLVDTIGVEGAPRGHYYSVLLVALSRTFIVEDGVYYEVNIERSDEDRRELDFTSYPG